MHDLIRAHARALAEQLDPGDDRDQAITRLLDYYQHAAAVAESQLALQARPAPAAGTAPTAVPALVGREQAMAWARAERPNLVACLDHAAGTGEHARVIALTAGIAFVLRHDGLWAEALTRHAAALSAARQLGDRPGQADALTNLGDVRRATGDRPGAARDDAAWGYGYATEAARVLLQWAFGTLDLNRVQAETDTRNVASARVLEKLGFVREGTLREDCVVNGEVSDSWVYGLIRREWRPPSEPVPAR
jgi:Acetyltransferase (GNAT) domain/Tetratricopeptide repeat